MSRLFEDNAVLTEEMPVMAQETLPDETFLA